MLRSRSRLPVLVQLWDLFLIELTNFRWSWRAMLLTGMLSPLGSMVMLAFFARDAGKETLAYVLVGNVVMALVFENQDKVQGHFAFMRFRGGLDYFATLPVYKYALILASVSAFLLLSLPSLVVTISVGSLFLGIPVRPHSILLIVVPLCAVPMAGIGALIGSTARTPEESGSLGLLVTLAMVGLGPVVVPPDRLPALVVILGRFSPATYAASALRQALLGPVTWQSALDLFALVGFTAASFWLTGRAMDWRQR
jgi:ABC-2 type transport system permease protein